MTTISTDLTEELSLSPGFSIKALNFVETCLNPNSPLQTFELVCIISNVQSLQENMVVFHQELHIFMEFSGALTGNLDGHV